ncbi:MAG TPA: hypothetical protein VFW87_22200 [Pirellulales bacterium]|nr:hypothetical protein [Pirellulales bacterium]
MRRVWLVAMCLSVLAVGGATTALAHGPHHGFSPQARYGYGNYYRGGFGGFGGYGFGGYGYGGGYNVGYRGGCGPGRGFAAYPAYPVYPSYPVAGYGYTPQLGFGVAGRNFSLFFRQ